MKTPGHPVISDEDHAALITAILLSGQHPETRPITIDCVDNNGQPRNAGHYGRCRGGPYNAVDIYSNNPTINVGSARGYYQWTVNGWAWTGTTTETTTKGD